jgi:hypothetical protein
VIRIRIRGQGIVSTPDQLGDCCRNAPDRFDVYYGMADYRIGVARLDVPDVLPPGGVAHAPDAKV